MNRISKKLFKVIIYIIPIFIAFLAIFLGFYLKNTFNGISEAQFEEDSANYEKIIQNKFKDYEALIDTIQAALAVQPTLNRKTFNDYFDLLTLSEQYPGISAFAYFEQVDVNNKSEFEDFINADTSYVYNTEEPQNFKIKPINDQSSLGDKNGTMYIISYLHPFEGRGAALGLDLSTEKLRKEAIEKTILTGKPAVSQVVTFTPSQALGFHLITKIDEKEGQERIGFITAGFKVEEFFNKIIENLPSRAGLYLEIKDPTGETLFSNLDGDLNSDSLVTKTNTIRFGGSDWTMISYADKNYSLDQTIIYTPLIASGFGIVMSVLSSFIIYLLFATTARANRIASIATRDLRITEKQYNDILNNTSSLIYLKDLEGNYLFVNNSFLDKLNLKYKKLLGRRTIDLFDEDIAKEILNNENKVIESVSEILLASFSP